MQHIQDKDLDQLFKDKLGNAAVQPPDLLWKNIEKELKPKPKRSKPILWMAAAIAVVAVTAALLFNKEAKIQLQGKAEVVVNSKKPAQVKDLLPLPIPETNAVVDAPEAVKLTKVAPVPLSERKLIAMQPLAKKDHLNNNITIAEPVLKVAELQIKANVLPDAAVLIAQVNTLEMETAAAVVEQEQTEKNGIRNIGDLVNFVVEKVDKREQKFLRFKTDDDDNSALVAINIGIIKLNGKNKLKR
ncbi:hypothetical protein AAKU52_001655 [Pedobacter sp. CG_S7]|uniref:hypothetical protein n=1 Tax=Pedobacter sp. CG_S7 TaxID=3143930 RepID=UPI003394217D